MAALLVAGCGGSSGGAGDSVDPDAFRGAARTVDGGEVDLADFAGRDLVVWFWAPW